MWAMTSPKATLGGRLKATNAEWPGKATLGQKPKTESRKQVRSVKVCAAGDESPPSSAARLPEFRMKVMNGKV
jgi:hypothetical protein